MDTWKFFLVFAGIAAVAAMSGCRRQVGTDAAPQQDAAPWADFSGPIRPGWQLDKPFADDNSETLQGFLVVEKVKDHPNLRSSGVEVGDICLSWGTPDPEPPATLREAWLAFLANEAGDDEAVWFARNRDGRTEVYSCSMGGLFECMVSLGTFGLTLRPVAFPPEEAERIRTAAAAQKEANRAARGERTTLSPEASPGCLFRAAHCEEIPLPAAVGKALLALLDDMQEWPGERAPADGEAPLDWDRLAVETDGGRTRVFHFSPGTETVLADGRLSGIPAARREAVRPLLRAHAGEWTDPSQSAMDADSRRSLEERANAFATDAARFVLSRDLSDEAAGTVAAEWTKTMLECRDVLFKTPDGAEDSLGALMGPMFRDGEAEHRLALQAALWNRDVLETPDGSPPTALRDAWNGAKNSRIDFGGLVLSLENGRGILAGPRAIHPLCAGSGSADGGASGSDGSQWVRAFAETVPGWMVDRGFLLKLRPAEWWDVEPPAAMFFVGLPDPETGLRKAVFLGRANPPCNTKACRHPGRYVFVDAESETEVAALPDKNFSAR